MNKACISDLVTIYSKSEWKGQQLRLNPYPRTHSSSLIGDPLHRRGAFVTIDEPALSHPYHSSPWFTLQFTLGVVYSVDFYKYIMACSQHYSIRESTFPVREILRVWIPHAFFSLKPVIHYFCTVSIVFRFPEQGIFGISLSV